MGGVGAPGMRLGWACAAGGDPGGGRGLGVHSGVVAEELGEEMQLQMSAEPQATWPCRDPLPSLMPWPPCSFVPPLSSELKKT